MHSPSGPLIILASIVLFFLPYVVFGNGCNDPVTYRLVQGSWKGYPTDSLVYPSNVPWMLIVNDTYGGNITGASPSSNNGNSWPDVSNSVNINWGSQINDNYELDFSITFLGHPFNGEAWPCAAQIYPNAEEMVLLCPPIGSPDTPDNTTTCPGGKEATCVTFKFFCAAANGCCTSYYEDSESAWVNIQDGE
eukprot:TRINITY_DN7761_c0_g1_i1.p1 TRINITY_DN7761_c0_g1~~TRINITY_DN7761_c0_g1_i1.p1  ORF type:complete len:212 (-),score=25.04 TRINITY_DN7761_c0_g1_i1:95-670(-)